MTALDLPDARAWLVDDSLRALALCEATDGPIVDVGSGNGAPGIPLALSLPAREFVLVEAGRRRCGFLEEWAPPNTRVQWGRAERQGCDWAGIALAKALAPPAVAAEWCLPLVRPGGLAILWVGASVERERVARVAERLAARLVPSPEGLLVLAKDGPTPAGFPRREGVARRRPLA